jgi:hypothetical protein
MYSQKKVLKVDFLPKYANLFYFMPPPPKFTLYVYKIRLFGQSYNKWVVQLRMVQLRQLLTFICVCKHT